MHSDMTLLIDRSGSMISIEQETEEGIKEMLKDQKTAPGSCALSVYKFDDEIEQVINCQDILDVDQFNIEPRGGTKLYDAIVRTVSETDTRLSGLATPPDKVLFIVITDGLDNDSREATMNDARAIIEKFSKKWLFVYIGGNHDAKRVAGSLNIQESLSFQSAGDGRSIRQVTEIISKALTRFRTDKDGKNFFLPEDTK